MRLPIHDHVDEIVAAVRANQVTIVVGETGSGKTTQLPLILREAGFTKKGMIGITEPRRIAAISVAEYVAAQAGVSLGAEVGYRIRFDDRTAPNTRVEFMTDGIMLRELQINPGLRGYSVIVVDEVHERSVNIDFVLGLLKRLLTRRPDLKVVISSATIDVEKISNYFDGAPVVEVSGRTYPVSVIWDQGLVGLCDHRPWESSLPDEIVNGVASKIVDIHETQPDGDILVFVPGTDDINKIIAEVEKRRSTNLVLLPAHGSLPPQEQHKIFNQYPGKRKAIIATNVAETSITVDGVVYVVDTGFIKQTHFHPETGIESLDMVFHSKAGAEQRRGRAGRTREGICYRLYSHKSYTERPQFTEPEIRRTSLSSVVLQMEAMRIEDTTNFNFVDAPNKDAFRRAYEELIALGAINESRTGLSPIGKSMARLPLAPHVARMILAAEKFGCVAQVATVAAFMSTRSPFFMPRERNKQTEAARAHERFKVPASDPQTYLRVWDGFVNSGFDREWCAHNWLNFKNLREVREVLSRLLQVLRTIGMRITSNGKNRAVDRAVSTGLAYNLLTLSGKYTYNAVSREATDVFIHPGSALFDSTGKPRWFVAANILRTSKTFASACTKVELEWLPEISPRRFKFGEPQLVSYTAGDATVKAKRPVLMSHRPFGQFVDATTSWTEIGTSEIDIPIAEARKIQDNLMKIVKGEKEWAEITFDRVIRVLHGFEHLVAVHDGIEYRASYDSKLLPELGGRYYAVLTSAADSWLSQPTATIMFRVFDFGSEEKLRSTEVENKPIDVQDAVAKLREAWGTSKG